MSIKLRLAFLIGLLLLVFVFCLLAMRELDRRQLSEALSGAQQDTSHLLENWINLRARPLREFVNDVSTWKELSDYATTPAKQPDWPTTKLDPLLARRGLDAVWLVRGDGTVLHAGTSTGSRDLNLPLPASIRSRLAEPANGARVFFHPMAGGAWEVCAVKVDESALWLFAARAWDAVYVEQLGDLMDSKATLVAASAPRIALAPEGSAHRAGAPGPIVAFRALPGWDGDPVLSVCVTKDAPDIAHRLETERLSGGVFLLFGICLIAALAISLHRWVLQPLGWITESLARRDTGPIRPLLGAGTELSHVAGLIVTSFEDREKLSREIAERRHAEQELTRTFEERTRLGRDLHDGVIQSIYAAGMGVAAARKQMMIDPVEAEAKLAHVGVVLNDTIHEVRDFITGLEPSAWQDDRFSDTINRLFLALNPAGAAEVDLRIDEQVAARFPATLRAELLLVLREAISNALRHGRALHVTVCIRPDPASPDLAIVEVVDDGTGFEPAAVRRGKGLGNIFARAAAHDGTAAILSEVGEGTRLTLTIPLKPDLSD